MSHDVDETVNGTTSARAHTHCSCILEERDHTRETIKYISLMQAFSNS